MKSILRFSFHMFLFVIVTSCVSTPPTYTSRAPEERGERAILSKIKLEGEVNLGTEVLGIFSSVEQYSSGVKQYVLFSLKGNGTTIGTIFKSKGIGNYQFFNPGSITLDQATKLIIALDDYINKKSSDLDINQLYNFELITGVLDNQLNTEWKRIDEITFIINYSISNEGKVFRTIFSGAQGYQYFELENDQVQSLRDIIEMIIDVNKLEPIINEGI